MSTVPETGTLGQLCEELYGTSTTVSVRQEWEQAVRGVAARATEVLPAASAERVAKATDIVLRYGVELLPNGKARVESQSDAGAVYHLTNGTCDCKDFERAPARWCKHRLARALHLRAIRAVRQTTKDMEQADAPVETVGAPVVDAAVPADAPADIPPQYVVMIQGKPFIKYAGLLHMAHARGLLSLTTVWTYNDSELSLAQAVAVFPHGTYTECGDATPTNVTRKVAVHFRRVALTRASSRCLRNALGVDMVALEELAELADTE